MTNKGAEEIQSDAELSDRARNREESGVQPEHQADRQDKVQTSNNSRSGSARSTSMRLVKFVHL